MKNYIKFLALSLVEGLVHYDLRKTLLTVVLSFILTHFCMHMHEYYYFYIREKNEKKMCAFWKQMSS
ncbi:MAG: hypothetical protein H6850_01440 [Alphaproteobacteria bacterium]|nr:MAG: hypothetical protein H6850_01440 [Alphaproteobacteria bacterium]